MVVISDEYPKDPSTNSHDELVTQVRNAVQSDRSM
jgi:hypothetical protein